MPDDIQWQTAKQYASELAAELADLLTIQHDLEFAIRASELALIIPTSCADVSQPDLNDDLVRRTGLWHAAVISYARCFAIGVRGTRLSPDLFNSLGAKASEAITAHGYFVDLRNKYVAHSVNRFEEAKVALMFGDGISVPRKVIGAGPIMVRVAVEEDANVRILQQLATILHRQVVARVEETGKRVLAEAQQLDASALAELPDLGFEMPVQPGEVGKTRRR